MSQYNAIKARHRDAVLFFRMGDFFEMFGEDAKTGARVLGITLTSRGHGKSGDIPLAGFPHHALDGYLAKMLRAGHRVAICEQVEDPRLAKGIVKREVVQVVTPGTVTAENLLESRRNNFLSAVSFQDDLCGLASADVSTGEFRVTECPVSKLAEEIHSVGPAELVVPEGRADVIQKMLSQNGRAPVLTKREDWLFGRDSGYDTLIRHFKTASLKGFGIQDYGPGIGAAGAALQYLEDTQKTGLDHIRRITPYSDDAFMTLDAATRRNLEITASMTAGDREGTLVSIIDRTLTAMGGRTLADWLQRPLKRLTPVRERLDAVESLHDDRAVRDGLAEALRNMGDLERLVARVVTRRANPRDVAGLKRSLERIPPVREALGNIQAGRISAIRDALDPCDEAVVRIGSALTDDPPAVLSEGRIIREGYSAELDELRGLAFSGKDWIARLQTTERERTGIPSLKVGYNRVFGYYIEVTNPHLDKVPQDYLRKQTLVNAERFITPQLKEMEEKILKAEERMVSLETELFDALRTFVAGFSGAIQEDGRLIGELDALLSLARVAHENRYVKPDVRDDDVIVIRDGRHPVIERLLPPGEPFIANDVTLDNAENQILIITGPNMAGKSTYIRQAGLIVLLAQIGGYVPAASARIGLVDRIFTRVGAQDNLAAGESTFLVEMNETANILNNATPKSLILLDEIGRGTSTFDGLSIAWAVAEYIHNAKTAGAKTLFATHYHELTELALILPRVKNYNVAVKEWGDHVVFLRKIVPGGCDHSYGIQVARLAGLPKEVILRAREILHNLEADALAPNEMPKLAMGENAPFVAERPPQLNLFLEEESRLREAVGKLDIDSMTPIEALQTLAELKKMIRG
ncbi:MAG TPA: DNA mismatch repair protein MutS [bacterium]|nr:DNA mismatch repair protein MutS [bacterium]